MWKGVLPKQYKPPRSDEMPIGKRTKGHVKRRMQKKEPKVIEEEKRVLCFRMNKTSDDGVAFLRDLVSPTYHASMYFPAQNPRI